MKEKSQIEKKAEEKQITLLSTALSEASNADGHWLNASGKGYPRFYPRGVSVSAFNALFMTLHSDKNGCKTNQFTLFSDAKAQGASVRENEQGVPFLFYNWNKYVHRNNPEQVISRDDYMKLYEEEQKLYKGVHNREIRTLFNIDQTTLPYVDKERYETTLRRYGSAVERGYTEADNRRLHIQFNDFLLRMRDNLVPVRSDGSGVPHYETDKDAVYMPRQREFRHYHDYIQEALRQIVSATGHQQRLAREGMVMKNGVAPSEDAVRQERLVVELASGIKMLELGLPARLSEESLKTVEYWCRELKENPNLMDALESDVNNAIEVINKAERGEKIEYATMRNRRDTSTMQEQMPKHYFVANEIRQHPDKETKKIVLVIDPQAKTADVILPAGASTEVDNEIPGMNKGRIMRALQKEGIEQVRFYNTDGALGYRPDDSYFAEKMITLARLKNWAMEKLSTLDVASAVKQANEIGFDHVEMIQDDKKRWALYIKPENKSGYSIYPDKEDINRFFSTLKQAMDNIGKVRMELAHKYYALAEVKPDLKVDLFHSEMPEIDLNRIQRVSVFKTKQDGIQCVATIDGQENRNTFNSLQIQEEAEKLEWLNHNPNKAKLLYYLEDHPLLNGGISVLGLDHIDYTNRFYSLFDCNKGLVNMALLSIEDYSLKIGWRYQIGSERIDTTWKTLFHTNKDNINKIHDILYQLLKKADEFSDNILFNIVNEYLSSCQEYDWRYYITKYKSMRPEKYGMYYWYDYQTREKSSYRILMMLTEKSISGRNFNIFLIALRDKIRQENPELITRLGEYAYSNDGNKLELTFCNKCVYYTDSEFIIEDIEDSSNIIITDIQQDKVSGKDLEDRVELGYEALKKQGII